ncbi:hypothetical protein Droror1_Dr00018885 [Drosera rotundifolia]
MNPSICEQPLISIWVPLSNPSKTHLQILHYNSPFSFAKCFSSKSSSSSAAVSVATQDELHQSFMVSYLINSCGLSPQRADAVFRIYGPWWRFDGPEKPDSILAFLRDHGFQDDEIVKVISTNPRILTCTKKTLLPKLEFFYSMGLTKRDLPDFLVKTSFLRHGLDSYLIPLYRLLKDVLESDRKVVLAMKRLRFVLRQKNYKNLVPNLALLKEIGVPSSKVASFVGAFPVGLLIDPVEFQGLVDKVKALGFDVTKTVFVLALRAFSPAYRTTRDRCTEIYMEWGFSREDIMSASNKNPQCLLLSENKLRGTLEFLIGKMGLQVQAIVKCPAVLTKSLDERIIPRCSVIYVLVQKGLIKKNWTLSAVAFPVDSSFLHRFVNRHQHIALHLMLVYQRKVDPFKDSCALIGEMEQPIP